MVVDPSRISLVDRVALVTGAAMGIGQAIALTFARFGADLILCDRDAAALEDTAREVERLGRRAVREVLDVRDAEHVARFVSRAAEEETGRIDILVNNAGGTFQADFTDLNEKGQRALVDENFSSVTHVIRAALPYLPTRIAEGDTPTEGRIEGSEAGASIINITSIEAHRAGPGFAVYSAMKAAVANLTQSLALELGERGIRVNCIAPDAIPTPGIGPIRMRTPLAHEPGPDDVAGAALFLASPLSAFVTGTTIHVDGGNHAAGGWRRNDGGTFDAG